jgi:hypothetical protein
MFYLAILRVRGNPLTVAPVVDTSLVPANVADEAGWQGPAATLANAGLLAKPVSIQWVAFLTEQRASDWLATPAAATLLDGCFVSGYNKAFAQENEADHVVLVIHRWSPVGNTNITHNCNACPPKLVPGLWIGFGPNATPPAQTLVYSFPDAPSWATWRADSANAYLLDNALIGTRNL